ncbi:hypothetical protein BWQ96_06696 [Gracilariopsis chorda]|uniref:Uncharacterized protein n=1 Tax=Gracilariopsis chorda TaxID=448386 RepID=A0A2V3INC8_9FLOR|nr:hypothetical protein BWQ96_06696 [Gracilariopsis chorda]|eukprot:PXF43584.1 hypothetical protein BWQ96_06696 [Gracilariopsis chorda]
MAPVFIIGGVGGFGIAITAVVLRQLARGRKAKRSKPKQVIEYQSTGCCLSRRDIYSETENLLETCNTVCPACVQKTEPTLSMDAASARSGAVIESHPVTTSSPFIPKSISRLSSMTFDSKVCVDAYASLLANEGFHEDVSDDAGTITDESGSRDGSEEHRATVQHEEGPRVDMETEPTTESLVENMSGEADTHSGTHWVQGNYEQNSEFLLEPKSPVIRQPTPIRVPEREISVSQNSSSSPTLHAPLEFDYDADDDGGTGVNGAEVPVPSLFLQDAIISSEMGHSPEPQREGSAVIISTSSARTGRERTIVSFTAAPLASVPALEDVVSGNPIPSTEILVHEDVPNAVTEATNGHAHGIPLPSDHESNDRDLVSLEEEQSLPQIPFMRNLSTSPEEQETNSQVSSDLSRHNSDAQSEVSLFKVICNKNTPIIPTVTRERSELASTEGIEADGPAATRPLREEDVERMKALANPPRAEDSDKENAFQSASTSPERLSRKPWRSERISSVFSRKNSVRRLRIPDRIRRRNMLTQKNNTTSQ